MAFTVQVVFDYALNRVGIENPTADEYSKAMAAFNVMLASITTESYSIISTTEDTKTLTASTGTYTYGTGGDINSARPTSIEYAFLRDTNDDDHPIEIISEIIYNRVVSKDTEGVPSRMTYKPNFPLGSVILDPVPDDAYVLHIFAKKSQTSVTAITDSITLPDEYQEYFATQLLLRLAPLNGYTLSNEEASVLRESKLNVKTVNSPKKLERKAPIELLRMGQRRIT